LDAWCVQLLTIKKESIMTKLKELLKSFTGIAEKAPEQPYETLWLQKSKKIDNDEYENVSTTVEEMMNDKTDEYIYNVWAEFSSDGLTDFDNFVENELIPNGMRTIQNTALFSKDEMSIRYMIARPKSITN
jgi:cobalamin biosynthesis Co2+ chelatase CbiK